MKHIPAIKYILCIVFFAGLWLLMNNSHRVNRDEMWYSSYGIELNDSETSDIRHITEYDIHQIAFPLTYRLLQRITVESFGKNLFGLRAINIFFGILMLTIVAFALKNQNLPVFFLFLFILLLTFYPVTARQMHNSRPDWTMGCIAAICLCLIHLYFVKRKIVFLYIAGFLAGFSAGIYWNGLAVMAAFALIMLLLTIRKEIRFKHLVGISITIFVFSVIFCLLPIFFNWDTFIAMTQNSGLQTSRLATGSGIRQYPSSLVKMIWRLLTSGPVNWLLAFLLFSTIICYATSLKNENRDHYKQAGLYILPWFVFFYALIVAIRDSSPRHVYHVLPAIFFIHIMALSHLTKNRGWKTWSAATHMIFAILGCFIIASASKTSFDAYFQRGQWQAYKQWANDIRSIIPQTTSRVMTTYNFAWALEGYNKFYLENTIFQKPTDIDQASKMFTDHNIEYIHFGERTRLRMDNPGTENYQWYGYWNKILERDYEKVGTVYNRYYRHNKGVPSADERGFRTEIWKRI